MFSRKPKFYLVRQDLDNDKIVRVPFKKWKDAKAEADAGNTVSLLRGSNVYYSVTGVTDDDPNSENYEDWGFYRGRHRTSQTGHRSEYTFNDSRFYFEASDGGRSTRDVPEFDTAEREAIRASAGDDLRSGRHRVHSRE